MATYQTRHLEATREISHGDRFLKPGETFEVSEVDAEHYLRRGHAKVVEATKPPEKAPPKTPAAKAVAKTISAKSASATRAPAGPVASSVVQASDDVPTTPTAEPTVAPETWERTEPLKLADVPHPDAGTPPTEG